MATTANLIVNVPLIPLRPQPPHLPEPLEAGEHDMRIAMEGFLPWVATITILVEENLEFAMSPARVQIRFRQKFSLGS